MIEVKHTPFEVCDCRPQDLIYHCLAESEPVEQTPRVIAIDYIEANIRKLRDGQIDLLEIIVRNMIEERP